MASASSRWQRSGQRLEWRLDCHESSLPIRIGIEAESGPDCQESSLPNRIGIEADLDRNRCQESSLPNRIGIEADLDWNRGAQVLLAVEKLLCNTLIDHLHRRQQLVCPSVFGFLLYFHKRDGKLGVGEDGNHITKIVRNYLKHEMILIPINIKEKHWYLAIINTQKCKIQVLDSLCWDFNRGDLADTLQGLQYHLNIIGRQQNLISHNWKDLQVISWIITEQLQEPMQKDGSSCGLFMLKFMEYWTGDSLSHPITQEDINYFRFKLAGILLCWKTNTAQTTPQNISLLGSSDGQKEPKASDSLSEETKYQSLMSVLSKISVHELVGGLCDYIKSINCPETLEKVWVRNSKPYSISLTLRKLQEILKEDLPMDRDCFNLVI
nr:uncharacterized protein LOC117849279 [Setaria viridis]